MNVTNNPETNKLFAELASCGFEIMNDKIESTLGIDVATYGDNRTDRTSLDGIANRVEKENAPTQHQLDKAARAKRVAAYSAQYAADGHFDYDVNERRLNGKMIDFCGHAVRAGFMDADDFETE